MADVYSWTARVDGLTDGAASLFLAEGQSSEQLAVALNVAPDAARLLTHEQAKTVYFERRYYDAERSVLRIGSHSAWALGVKEYAQNGLYPELGSHPGRALSLQVIPGKGITLLTYAEDSVALLSLEVGMASDDMRAAPAHVRGVLEEVGFDVDTGLSREPLSAHSEYLALAVRLVARLTVEIPGDVALGPLPTWFPE